MSRSISGSLRPEDFPIRSPESRAAARAMLEAMPRLQIVIDIPRPHREGQPDTKVGDWMVNPRGGLVRIVQYPPGTDEETIQRLLATP